MKDFNKIGAVIENGRVNELTYADYLSEYHSDETTSPRGVEPRLHIRDNSLLQRFELWTWGTRGCHPRLIKSFETMEQAELERLKEWDSNACIGSGDAPRFFESKEEAVQVLGDRNEEDNPILMRQIKEAIKGGKELYCDPHYIFVIDKNEDLLIHHCGSDYYIGAFWKDMRGKNFERVLIKENGKYLPWSPN